MHFACQSFRRGKRAISRAATAADAAVKSSDVDNSAQLNFRRLRRNQHEDVLLCCGTNSYALAANMDHLFGANGSPQRRRKMSIRFNYMYPTMMRCVDGMAVSAAVGPAFASYGSGRECP
jgi:hypothetical protein